MSGLTVRTTPAVPVVAPSGDARGVGSVVALRGVVAGHVGRPGAVSGLDLDVAAGELVALLGPAGCGATTVLRVLAGTVRAASGAVLVDDRDVAGVPSRRREVGATLPGGAHRGPFATGGAGAVDDRPRGGARAAATVRRRLATSLRRHRVRRSDRGDRVDEVLALTGLLDVAELPVRDLTPGRLQRLLVAQALAGRPRVLLLDEPFEGIDAQERARWRDDLRTLQRAVGVTTLLVTHDQPAALAVADRVAVLHDGLVEQVGTPEQLYTAPATRFVAEFLGSSNRLRAEAVDGRVRLPGCEVGAVGPCEDGPVWAHVRPEDLVFAERGVAGVVEGTTFLGSVVRSRVRLGGGGVGGAGAGTGGAGGIVVELEHPAREGRPLGSAVHVAVVATSVAVVPAD